MRTLIIGLGLSIITSAVYAGECVNSSAYNLMLKGLLSHSVPEVCIDSVQKNAMNYTWLDAREPNEFTVSQISGAIPVGYDQFKLSSVDSLDKNTPIIVYCSVGYRSEKVAEKLIKAGFTNVQNLYGGMFEWSNKNLPLFKGDSLTPKIHAYNKLWGKWITNGEKVYSK